MRLRKPAEGRWTEGALASWLTLRLLELYFLCASLETLEHTVQTFLTWGSGYRTSPGSGSSPVEWTAALGNLWSRAVAWHDGTCLQFQHLKGVRKTRSLGVTWATWDWIKKIGKSSSWRLVDYHYNAHIVPFMWTSQSSLLGQSDGVLCACMAWLCSPRRQNHERLKATVRRQSCGSDPGDITIHVIRSHL